MQTVDHRLHRHAALGVGLRVKKEFSMHHMVGRRALKVGPRHVVKVLLMQQHAGPGVVNVQKALQVGEGIGRTQRLHAGIRQRHTVALCQRNNQLGLQ